MNYHKVYMNHVHSSSLLTQLATMWKSQTLCDAVIRTGSIITKAHRVVLVAACPMLQSMENATSGSHLEVRLASDIKQDSINTFLQYLYEGFMILTEDNCKDVEKIARLLQVDGVIKCCLDFIKCLNASSSMQFKYSFHDQTEFKHVRVSEMFKVHERQQKRQSEALRPSSPGSKRQRILRPSSPPQDVMQMGAGKTHDTERMTESYKSSASDPWDRVPRLGSQGASSQGASSQPGVIDIREDCLELVQTEPPKDSGGGRSQEPRKVQSSVSISVASQHNTNTDLRIINVDNDSSSKVPSSTHPSSSSTRGPITVSPLTMYHDSPASSSSSVDSTRVTSERHPVSGPPPKPPSDHERQIPPTINLTDFQPLTSDSFSQVKQRSSDSFSTSTPQRGPYPVSLSTAQRTALSSQSKSFAAGSASQASMSHSFTEGMPSTGQRSQQPSASSLGKSDSMEGVAIEKSIDISAKMKSDDTPSTSDMTPDISIVKVEAASEAEQAEVEGGLDMYVTAGGVSVTSQSQARPSEDDDMDPADFDLEEPPGDWSRDEQMSNEASNVSGDQSGSWYTGQYKDTSTLSDVLKHKPGIYDEEVALQNGLIELAPGLPVYIHPYHYKVALNKIKISQKTGKPDGTPAARYLLGVFYTNHELVNATNREMDESDRSQSSFVPLNKTILYAIEGSQPGQPWQQTEYQQPISHTEGHSTDNQGMSRSFDPMTSTLPSPTSTIPGNDRSNLSTAVVSRSNTATPDKRNSFQVDSLEKLEQRTIFPPDLFSYTQANQFCCVLCSTHFQDNSQLREHIQNCHGNFLGTDYCAFCEFCGRGFKSREGYSLHKKMYHTEKSKFPACTVCGKRFHCAASLATHEISHSQLKAFKCDICQKSFKFKGSLKAHTCK